MKYTADVVCGAGAVVDVIRVNGKVYECSFFSLPEQIYSVKVRDSVNIDLQGSLNISRLS